jgi:hypothetical protein
VARVPAGACVLQHVGGRVGELEGRNPALGATIAARREPFA